MVSSSAVPASLTTTWRTTANALHARRPPPRLCSACDHCRQSRVRCAGGNPCQRCRANGASCHYSVSMRSGRLRATANRVQKPTSQSPTPSNETSPNGRSDADSITFPPHSIAHSHAHHVPSPSDKDFSSAEECGLNSNPLLSSSGDLSISDPLGSLMDSSSSSSNLLPLSDMFLDPDLDTDSMATDNNWDSLMGLSSLSLPLDVMNFGSGRPGPPCSCLKSQLLCIAELCGPQDDVDGMGLDTILETSRQTCEQTAKELSCSLCSKCSTRYILTVIAIQQVLNMFCRVSKNGACYVSNSRLGLGSFQLSEEEDRNHKRLLVASSLKRVDALVDQLESSVQEFQQAQLLQQKSGEMATETGRSNLKWSVEAVLRMKSRTGMMLHLLEAPSWGTMARHS